MYDAVIIGAGVVGCAVARELSRYRLKTVVLEKGESLKIVGKEIINNLENKLKKDITQEELDIFKKVCRLLIKNMEK